MEHDSLYFAYGSNLNAKDLNLWCQQHGFAYPLGEKVANAFLPDTRLIFNYLSKSRNGGMLNITYQMGHVTPGVLFRVLPGGWEALDAKGTDENMYKHLDSITLTEDGQEHLAVAYQVDSANTSRALVKPHPDYLDVVREGLQFHGIDDNFLTPLSLGKIPPLMIEHLFVYGTLMSGRPRHFLFRKWTDDPSSKTEATAPGRLFDSARGFPCMIPDATGHHTVTGELYRLKDFKKVFEKLDYMEMSENRGSSNVFFRRAIVRVTIAQGRTCLAWSYLTESSIRGMQPIPSGNWKSVTT